MDNNEKTIIIFDGVCNLCNKTVQFILKRDPEAKFRFASLQSEIGQSLLEQYGLPPGSIDSLIYSRDNRYYTKSTAVLMILRDLGGGWQIWYFSIIIPRFLRDRVYDFIAKRRYRWFGRSDSCMIPDPKYLERFLE